MEENNLNILVSIVSFIVVLIFLFFAFFLLTVKTKNKTRNGLLAAYLIITAFDISAFFYHRFITPPPEIEILRAICFPFLKAPLVYLYVVSLIYTDFKLKPKDLIHLVPSLLPIIVLIPNFYLKDDSSKHYFLDHFDDFREIGYLLGLLKLQAVLYTIANILQLRKYKTLLFENYANNISLSNYRWLSQLVTIGALLTSITVVKDILKVTQYKDIANVLTVVMLFGGLGYIFWIVLSALYSPDLFRGVDSKLQSVNNMVAETLKRNNNIDNDALKIENQERTQKLRTYMVAQEPYLEPSLTIQDLADQMNTPMRDLSILINHHLDQHFFDFVNEYRIRKAMELLKDPEEHELTILEILYRVGFNSKSSFHTAFKKYTDLTPTAYRRKYLQDLADY